MRPRSGRSRNSTNMHVKYLISLVLVLLHQPGICLFEREVGTSFTSATVAGKANKQVQMQVCITIGCCHHVCRQFVEDSSSTAEVLKQTTLAPFTLQSTPQLSPADEEQADASDNVVIVPSILEWSSRPVFSPSIKFLTILNTDNTSWIKVSTPVSTDEQFFVQAIDRTAIAPGESLKVPVVFLPRKPGPAAGRIILETSAGKVASLLRGEGHPSPHHLPELVGIEAVEGKPQQHRIRFHNPYEEVVEIDEVQVWPEDAHNKALCLSDDTEERITSCFADSFAKAALSKARNQKYASNRATISLTQLDQWKIQPQETAELVEVETTVTGTWSGLVYIKFSRNNAEEVAVIPLELNIGSEKDAIWKKVSQRSQAVPSSVEQVGEVPMSQSKWMQTNDAVALRVAESLLKDLAHKLLKRSDIRKGSLAASQKEATLVPEEFLAYPLVQTGRKESLWIHLVNTGDEPVAVNLILSAEVKSTDCQYKANWLWQGHKPQMHKQNTVFTFASGAVTEAVMKRRSKLALGPVTFHPRQRCDWSGLLFIKNNVTGLEWIPVRGKGGSARLVFLDEGKAVKRLEMIVDDPTDSASREETCSRTVQKAFQVKNTGDLPLEVHGMNLEYAPRISLQNSDGFTLAVGETTSMMVSYTPEFEGTEGKQVLRMATSIGVVNIPVTPKLPRELVARCRSFRLHERIALPVSICALVLVLGIFFSLLLQELSPKRDIRKQIMQCLKTWKHTIASRFKATRGKTLNLKFEESRHLKPLRTSTSHRELHELPEKNKLRRKKKSKSSSSPRSQSSLSPRSQCSSSGPPSPHSCSESEMKVAPIERYFSSSRFSESPRKPKPRNLEKKKVAAHEDVQAAWDGFKISPKEQKPTNVAEGHESTLGALSTQPHPEDAPFSHPSPVVTPENVRTEVSGYKNLTRQDGSSCVSPVGHNRNQDTSSKQQPEAFYDIWGDHFADIRGAFSTPGSPSGFLDNSQSLFSQSLPRSTGLRYSPEQNEVNEFQLQEWFNIGDDILRSSEDRINVPDHSQLPRSEDIFGVEDFLPGIETCTSLLGTSYFDWNNDHLYRVPVS